MHVSTAVFVFLYLTSASLSLAIIIFFFIKGKRTALQHSFIMCLSLEVIWSLDAIRFMFYFNITLSYIVQVFITFLGFSWFLFSLYFTESKMLNRKNIIYFLGIPPAVLSIIVLTNNYHHLFYTISGLNQFSYGTFFWLHMLQSYTYTGLGIILLLSYSFQKYRHLIKQSMLLALAVLLPVLANVLTYFKIIDTEYDLTPVSFSFSMLLFVWATFKYRFLNIMPIATRKIVDNMPESIIVIDNFNRIMDFNDSFKSVFKDIAKVTVDEDIYSFITKLKPYTGNQQELDDIGNALKCGSMDNTSWEICLVKPIKRYCSVNLRPILTKKNGILGKVISFNDISEYKDILFEVDEKNIELIALNEQLAAINQELNMANEQLKDYTDTIEELAVIKERNRFARDVHDTLGHSMALLIALLEVCSVTCKTDPALTEDKLNEALKTTRDGLKELRRSISGLSPEKLETSSLVNAVNNLVSEFRASGMNVELTMQGIENYERNPLYSDAIYRTCQEALTNSLRHGKAQNANIIIQFSKECIRLYMIDDGGGCTVMNKGYGLKGMEQRIKDLNGTISYGSDGEKGFNIRVEIPVISNNPSNDITD